MVFPQRHRCLLWPYRPCYFGGDAAEIAISIAAELIAVRARREGREKHRPAAK